jgi:hypothetical protein
LNCPIGADWRQAAQRALVSQEGIRSSPSALGSR